jgi:PKD repeat protein
LGDAVSFTNTSANASTYQWDFGDGSGTSTQTNPSYTYAHVGQYLVTLDAGNPAGTDTYQMQIAVTQSGEPEIYIYLPSVMKGAGGSQVSQSDLGYVTPPYSSWLYLWQMVMGQR